jgi:hypothetical protein
MTLIEGCLKDYLRSTEEHEEAAEHLENACHNLREQLDVAPQFVRLEGMLWEVNLTNEGDLEVRSLQPV